MTRKEDYRNKCHNSKRAEKREGIGEFQYPTKKEKKTGKDSIP